MRWASFNLLFPDLVKFPLQQGKIIKIINIVIVIMMITIITNKNCFHSTSDPPLPPLESSVLWSWSCPPTDHSGWSPCSLLGGSSRGLWFIRNTHFRILRKSLA